MLNGKNIQINSLGFDTIRASLKEYLKEQKPSRTMTSGSGMAVLLDLLAYQLQAGILQQHGCKRDVLDSVIKRDSVVSHAVFGIHCTILRAAKALLMLPLVVPQVCLTPSRSVVSSQQQTREGRTGYQPVICYRQSRCGNCWQRRDGTHLQS